MKLNALKVDLAKRILEADDEQRLLVVESVLKPHPGKLTAAQMKALDKAWERYTSGGSAVHSWEAVKAHVRGRRRK